MKKKLFSAFVAIAAALSMFVSACAANTDDTAHEHEWSSSWSHNDDYHWHACEECSEVNDRETHTFGAWEVVTPATETSEGEEKRECTVCGYEETRVTPALTHTHSWSDEWTTSDTMHWHVCLNGCDEVNEKEPHSFGNWQTVTPATETSEGEEKRECSVCGYEETRSTPVLTHTHSWSGEWTTNETMHWHACLNGCDQRNDEDEHNFVDGKCSVCGYDDPNYVPAHQHEWSQTYSSNASEHWKTCSGCDEVNEKESHSFGNWQTVTPATETSEGLEKRACSVCGYEESRPIDKLAHTHSWASAWSKDETGHWYACSGCAEKGSYDVHNLLEGVCVVCGWVDPDYQPVHSHEWSAGYSYDATKHWKTCSGCEEISEEGTHTYGEWVTTVPPTAADPGTKVKTCTVCGYQIEESVPATGVTPPEVDGSITITDASGHLESAYVIWEPNSNYSWYNVYYKQDGAADSSYVKLDNPLVRQYSTYYRADAVGLAPGSYTLKIVPTDDAEAEITDSATTVSNLTVLAHERYGYAFVNGTSSGAYNDDGTLKDNATVIYVTEANKNSVTATIGGTQYSGIGNIVTNIKRTTTPVSIRFIGNITKGENFDKGDFLIDNDGNAIGITVEGIGNDATANGWGLRLKNSSNVEVRNLGFMNCNSGEGDNVGLQQNNDHVWVHNCDLFYGDAGSDADQVKGDGALDTKKSTYVTHSYNHFWDSGKCNLQGMKSETTSNFITYHHNWYDHSDSRHPRIRTCTVHIFNNYFDGNAKYGVGVTMGASAFVENNYFRSEADQKPMMSSMQGTDIAGGEGTFSGEDGGIIKSYGNKFAGNGKVHLVTWQQDNTEFDVYEANSRDEQVPSSVKTKQGGTTYNNFDTASDFYEYEVDTAEVAKAKVEQYAGRVQGGDFKWDFDDATEDGNYDVIQELKDKLMSYSSDLVRVGDGEVIEGGGSSEGGETGGETGGEQGGEEQPGGGSIVEGSTLVTFEMDGGYSNTVVNGVTISGNPSDSKGSMNVGGTTYSVCLKMESSTNISFTPGENMTMTLYLDAPGKSIKINGEKMSVGSDGTVTVELAAGTAYTITKGDTMNLFAIVLSPKA